MADSIRILLLADSHLGFDLPLRPRVKRRRRGHDFFANFAAALQPALGGEVDVVAHAGDVFDRPTVAPSVAYEAYELLGRVADAGVPVFVVPGNHERSRLPHARLASHPGVHVFDEPRTFVVDVRGARIALAGFPHERHDVRARFTDLLRTSGWRDAQADVRLLCMHHCVEGATVGPANHTFTTAADVVRLADVPDRISAVLTGHVHRHQVLTSDLRHRPLGAPVLYPGSLERTSAAEIGETKGYVVLEIESDGRGRSEVRWEFRALSVRPMLRADLVVTGMTEATLTAAIERIVAGAPGDAVLSIRVVGEPTPAQWRAMSTARLRALVPDTMNVDLSTSRTYERTARGARRAAVGDPGAQLSFC